MASTEWLRLTFTGSGSGATGTSGGYITTGFHGFELAGVHAPLPAVGPPVADHVFNYVAGRGGWRISLCSRCGVRFYTADQHGACRPCPADALRERLEAELAKATATYGTHIAFVRADERRRRVVPAPAYQNVSAAVRNVVGGWNRR